MSTPTPPHGVLEQLNTVITNAFSYVRLPVLASSGVAAVLSGLLYFKQSELIYPRNIPAGARTEVPRPRDFGCQDYEELNIPTPDGESLGAYLIHASNRSLYRNVTVLMFHGNAGNIGHRVPIALRLTEDLDCNVMMLEYRGYGFSTGTPDEQGLFIDAQTGLDYILARADLRSTMVVVYGQSLGGALSIQLVAKNQTKVKGLILENTFTSMRKLIPSAFPPARYLARFCHQVWPSEAIIPAISDVPILFLSGLKDEIVPPSHMQQLYKVCQSRKKVWKPLPNGTHNESVMEPGYFEALSDFIRNDVMKKS